MVAHRSPTTRLARGVPVLAGTLLRWVGPAAVLLVAAALVSQGLGRTLADVVVDPSALTGTSPFLGLASHLGVLAWTAAATTALLAAADPCRPAPERTWLRRVGGLGVLAALDDLLVLHERLDRSLPDVVPGDPTVPVAALVAVAVVATGRRWLVRRDDALVLVGVAALFGASAAIDVTEHLLGAAVPTLRPVVLYVEESFKLCGIALWLGFLVRVARHPS